METKSRNRRVTAALAVTILVGAALTACGETSDGETASGPVRGFDGETITVAGLGVKAQMPASEIGAKARIERFNKDQEIEGVQIDYQEFADDQGNPATSLSEARRLVTAEDVFAIVGDVSQTNPVQYLAQQEVPYFGFGLEPTYCSTTESTELWGFGFSGCLTPPDPSEMPNTYGLLHRYASEKTGSDSPTAAVFSSDTEPGRISVKYSDVAMAGTGFDVVLADGMVPPPPVSDYTPYVQQLLESDDGDAPDVIQCLLGPDCVPIYALLQANGFEGIYSHSLWADAVVQPMAGTVVPIAWANPNDPSDAAEQMRADIEAVAPGQQIDIGAVAGYFSTSMFIDALKLAAEDGLDSVTPASVRDAASTMTFEIEGLVGPTPYPESTAIATGCRSLLESTGTEWKTVEPFECLPERFPVEE